MITEQRARDIAAGFQSPGAHGHQFATFASTGRISCTLDEDIDREIGSADDKGRGQLLALKGFIVGEIDKWAHDIVAGMTAVSDEDEEAVNATRDVECLRCGRKWPQNALNWERGVGDRSNDWKDED